MPPQSLLVVAAIALAIPLTALAGPIEIRDAYAHATSTAQPVGAGFVTVANSAAADRLVSVSCTCSQSAELHSMTMDGGVMKMRKLEGIDVPAKGSLVLEPGGMHLMLIGLKAPLAEGQSVPLELRFDKAGVVKTTLKVKSRVPAGHEGHEHMHKH
ncbi:MAG: copper chaperone PCu(A)C [Burkholderiales bacterium]|nr:copper chaperone PCu(A)C [Burkholderiales bacterium]